MYIFLAFLLVPLIEIALFIQVGGAIGLWPTLFIVVLTAVIGTYLVRSQGIAALGNVQRSFNQLDDPSEPLAHGAMILFSGALLLTPGFFTDAVGFALLTPAFRNVVIAQVRKRVKIHSVNVNGTGFTAHTARRSPYDSDDVIDGDYQEVTPKQRSGPSGWVEKD